MQTPDDAEHLAEQFAEALPPEQQEAFIQSFLQRGTMGFEDALRPPDPEVGEVPDRVRGFRVRLDLLHTKPPVWRRLELPGDLTLSQVHEVVQAAMGWFGGHLHKFSTGGGHRGASFLAPFDLEEGESGVYEGDVRLDQVVSATGDRLWYEYDFGDDWEHVIAVEEVLGTPPMEPRCTAGRKACPPEDCGGVWGYLELAEWVRQGSPADAVPDPFDDAEEVRDWLPLDWHPDEFDVAEADAAVAFALAGPVPVAEGLAALRDRAELFGEARLTALVTMAAAEPPSEMDEGGAARLVEPFTTLLDAIGDGVRLTGAGYLPPALVQQLADRLGVSDWWIGKANREDLTTPIALLREAARDLGLVSVRKGRLAPTAAARRCREAPLGLWRHIVSRLPAGRTDFHRQAGWVALVVVGSGVPAQEWYREIQSLLVGLGWRTDGPFPEKVPSASPTLTTLDMLAGQTRQGRLTGVDPAVAATARAVTLV